MKRILIIFILFIFLSCNNENFSPVVGFEDKLIMNCVLDARGSKQFVYLQKTFLLNDSLSNEISQENYSISLLEDASKNEYIFTDTVITGIKKFKMKYLSNFSLRRGSLYTLIARKNGNIIASSQIGAPNNQYIGVSYEYSGINIGYGTSSNAKGYLCNMYVDYESEINKIKTRSIIEVPLFVETTESGQQIIYPSLTKEKQMLFSLTSMIYAMNIIKPNSPTDKIRIKTGYISVLCLDPNLYNYYLSMKNFEDPYSVRLDQSFYSNISHGYGIFGAITSDAITFRIPSEIISAFGYLDDQTEGGKYAN